MVNTELGAAAAVLEVGHWLLVLPVGAIAATTEMIKLIAFRDRAAEVLVDPTMDHLEARRRGDLPVPTGAFAARPEPAASFEDIGLADDKAGEDAFDSIGFHTPA